MPICQREDKGDFGEVVSLFEHFIPIMCYGCPHVSVHIYIRIRGCTRRWVSGPPLKLAHFPGRFVGGRPVSPADSEAWPLALHSSGSSEAGLSNQLLPRQLTFLPAIFFSGTVATACLVSNASKFSVKWFFAFHLYLLTSHRQPDLVLHLQAHKWRKPSKSNRKPALSVACSQSGHSQHRSL